MLVRAVSMSNIQDIAKTEPVSKRHSFSAGDERILAGKIKEITFQQIPLKRSAAIANLVVSYQNERLTASSNSSMLDEIASVNNIQNNEKLNTCQEEIHLQQETGGHRQKRQKR